MHLGAAQPPEIGFDLRMLIVPHAGYVYSGPTAGHGYCLLQEIDPERIVLLGPSHYVGFTGLALPGVDEMETPLGGVAVDHAAAMELLGREFAHNSAEAHRREHSLEVQLPFLQVVAPGAPVVPLLTGAVDPREAADLVEPLLDDQTLLVVSSDLSHYHRAVEARRLDAATATAISQLDTDGLGRESACGRTAIQVAIHIAKRRGYQVEILDLRNSADTAGTPERVVGYGSFAIG